jgi:low temperature requirement protein LtrA
MNKIWRYRQMIIVATIVLLLCNLVFWILKRHETLPSMHRQVLLSGVLLWIVSVLADKNKDDDWAGQF